MLVRKSILYLVILDARESERLVERDIYIIIKVRERKIRDHTRIKYIKDESNRVIVNDEKIKIIKKYKD